MANPNLIALQTDPTTWPLPVEGKTFIGIDESGQIVLKQHDGTLTTITSGGASLTKQTNSDGSEITVTPASDIHKEVITLTGAARTQVITIEETSLTDGAGAVLLFNLPATAGIVVEVYSDATLIWNFTNDSGAAIKAAFEIYKDGTVWKPLISTIPAFTPVS